MRSSRRFSSSAAGSVIHAVHSNEMTAMGGLGRKMPLTALTFTAGALSLRRRVPPFAGFGLEGRHPHAWRARRAGIPWALLLSTAFLTAFYMGRVLVLTFLGEALGRRRHTRTSPPW